MAELVTNLEFGGLELMLFEDLKDQQKRQAAFILAGIGELQPGRDGSDYGNNSVRISPSERSEESVDKKLEYLNDKLDDNVVVTAVNYKGNVVAVYEMPFFMRSEDKLSNSQPGHIIAEPEGQTIANGVLKLLVPILESLAEATESTYVTHYANSKGRSLFFINGYRDLGKIDPEGEHLHERNYFPNERALGPYQRNIVDSFKESILQKNKLPKPYDGFNDVIIPNSPDG